MTTVPAPFGTKPKDGIIYFMPKRPFKVTVTVDDKGVQTPTITKGDSLPDLKRRFVLKYNKNLFGTNTLAMTVNSLGLLQSANGTTTSAATDIAKNLGTFIGDVA